MVDGSLYVTTPRNRVLSMDPVTGATRWEFDPQADLSRRYVEDFVSRGVSFWRKRGGEDEPCATRLFLGTIDARVFALDATTGEPCRAFGDSGVIHLTAGSDPDQREDETADYSITSPPAVLGDVIIVGSAVRKNRRAPAPAGVVRAFDARTGEPRWIFEPMPNAPAHQGQRFSPPATARATGGANAWSFITVDTARDLVFLPTASPAPDHYGGDRPGRNDLANSVVAVRGSTGEVAWSFQVVHHDLWDYDVAAHPMLVDLEHQGEAIPAVVVGTKTGMLFVLNRVTGVPVWPVESRPVPASTVPGEKASPSQPFSGLPLLHSALLTEDSLFGVTARELERCRRRLGILRNDGIFTPPSLEGTLVWPGYWGGINWDGMAWDPERQLVITTVRRLAMVVQLHRRGDPTELLEERRPSQQLFPQVGTPYSVTREPFVAPSGTPCSPPPWGLLVAVDFTNSSMRWQRPLGTVPWLSQYPGHAEWGSLLLGGPLVTGGGLVFIAGAQDDRFRAFDVETGALLWETQLPAGGQAAPMTYTFARRQYIVIHAGGRDGIGSPGDWIVAYALPAHRTRSR